VTSGRPPGSSTGFLQLHAEIRATAAVTDGLQQLLDLVGGADMRDRAPKLDRLIVRFHRGGREIETEDASTGERALKVGLLMLTRLDYLQAGDLLTVDRAPASTTGDAGTGGGR
jgi:hypothetical protein